MSDEEPRRHHHYYEISEEQKKADRELSIKLARELAEKDKHYVPTEEEQRVIDRLEKSQRERSKRPVEPPRQPAKYDFAPGVASDGSLYPVHERKRPEPEPPAPQPTAVEDHEWDGVTLRTACAPQEVAQRDQIAIAARNGDWPQLFALLDTRYVNRAPVGSTDGIAPLHHAAWHGAPVEVVQRLIDLGAWRLLRTTAGQTPLAVAQQRGHQHLFDILQPVVRHPLTENVLLGLEEHLTMLIWHGIDGVLRAGGIVLDPHKPVSFAAQLRLISGE